MGETGATYILFQLGNATYGVPSGIVRQLEMIETITPVPNSPNFVEGVVLSRGQVIPAVNLRVRFGLEKIPFDLRTRLIVVGIGERTVGLIVDTAREFVSIPPDAIHPPPETLSGIAERYLDGVALLGDRLILLLDVEKVLDPADLEIERLGEMMAEIGEAARESLKTGGNHVAQGKADTA